MSTMFPSLSPLQRYLLYSFSFILIFGSGIYWFYATNKATVVKIKYQGTEGVAVLSKKNMEEFGNGLKRWTQKRTFQINMISPQSITTVQSKIKYEISELEQRLEAVVEVSKSIWKKYQEGDTLKIKYLPQDPVNYVMVLD